jgi:hypothetical protein
MHFNDLLIRLRTQALAGVAAISTLVSIFARSGTDLSMSWEVSAGVFGILCLFWIAIWIIDFWYYNKLLIGAVTALVTLEELSKTKSRIRQIDLSTTVENAVAGASRGRNKARAFKLRPGPRAFYLIVFLALLGGFAFSFLEYKQQSSSARGDRAPASETSSSIGGELTFQTTPAVGES